MVRSTFAASAAQRRCSCTAILTCRYSARETGVPTSLTIEGSSRSAAASSTSAKRWMCRARSSPESAAHPGNAPRAAATASSTWSAEAPPTVAMTSSVAGLTTSHVSPSGSVARPPMSSVRVSGTQSCIGCRWYGVVVVMVFSVRGSAGRAVIGVGRDAVLAQDGLADLLRRRLRQRRGDAQVARDGEGRDAALTPGQDLGGLDRGGGDDDREHLVLAVLLVGGDADDGALDDGRVAEDRLLDLVGADVLAAAPEGVLVAVDEVVPAVLVAAERVTGVEPEVAPRLDRLLRHVVVAVGAGPRVHRADDELADLAHLHLAVGLRVDQPDVEPLLVLQARRTRRPRLPVGRHDRRAGLGEPERVDERLDAVPLLELLHVGAGRGRGVHAAQHVVAVVLPRG